MFEFADRITNIIECKMCRILLHSFEYLRGPAAGKFLDGAHIQVAVMEVPFQRRHLSCQEASVLTDAVAAHRRHARPDPRSQKIQRLPLGNLHADRAGTHALRKTRRSMLASIPVIHALQNRLRTMNCKHRAFSENDEIPVGDDRGDFNDEIRIGLEARHLKIDPYQPVQIADTHRLTFATATASGYVEYQHLPFSSARKSAWSCMPVARMQNMQTLTVIFVALLICGTVLRLWLLGRQYSTVRQNRETVPAPFAVTISLEEHRRAADFTMAHARLACIDIVVGALLLLALTIGGGISAVDHFLNGAGLSALWHGVAVVAAVMLLTLLLDLPFSLWRVFRIEARFGFNRMTVQLFVTDLLKSLLVGVLLGGPLLIAVLLLMEHAGQYWWLFVFGVWVLFTVLVTWAWPTFIAPLFNQFVPLSDDELRTRVEALLARCGFTTRGVFVMDGSRRSTHGNAYFTGLGRHKRIVFMDTLIERLQYEEIEAVLAHELGHFSLHHVRKRLLLSLVTAFAGLAILGQLAASPVFYLALGVAEPSSHSALLLFTLAAPVVTFYLTPLGAWWSRRHEFEADQFASTQAAPAHLVHALVKLYRDNATTLTPDPVYAAFYFSHPPALTRIERLEALGRKPTALPVTGVA